MQVHAQAHTVHLGLIYLFLYLGLFHESIASPLSSIDSPQSLVLPPSMTNFNSTSGPKWEGGWPDEPFAVSIETDDPHDHCFLSFPKVGAKLGTDNQTQFFILEVLEQIFKLQGQPKGSVPEAFDVTRYDLRFKMESIAQHPMSLDLACTALKIMCSIVMDSGAREFQALVVCQRLALGRFRSLFLDTEVTNGALTSNATSFER